MHAYTLHTTKLRGSLNTESLLCKTFEMTIAYRKAISSEGSYYYINEIGMQEEQLQIAMASPQQNISVQTVIVYFKFN